MARYLGSLFFFSSRRRHTRCSRDWSSDVCSSDLGLLRRVIGSETVVAHPQIQREPSLEVPSVLQVEAGIAKIVFLSRRGVVSHDLEGCGEGDLRTTEDSVDTLIHLIDVRVVAVAPFKPNWKLCAPAQLALY